MSDSSELPRQLEETRDVRERCVGPIYLSLLHANFTQPYDAAAALQISAIARTITDEEITKLLEIREWRGRLVAGWCVGLTKRSGFTEQIGRLLLQSETVYAGQGSCIALGLIGDDCCLVHLQNYLREYLPFKGRFYDQQWAIGALAHIDKAAAEPFLESDLWTEGDKHLDPLPGIRGFQRVADLLELHAIIQPKE
jgi:hypothetical protein